MTMIGGVASATPVSSHPSNAGPANQPPAAGAPESAAARGEGSTSAQQVSRTMPPAGQAGETPKVSPDGGRGLSRPGAADADDAVEAARRRRSVERDSFNLGAESGRAVADYIEDRIRRQATEAQSEAKAAADKAARAEAMERIVAKRRAQQAESRT
ncbi:MAG: hypothetical protein ACK4WC_11685 [Rubrimonas sp.]